MENYNIIQWTNFFENGGGVVDPKKDFLESDSIVLYPGRFYVLEYSAKTKDVYNARPVIISMGISKKDPDANESKTECVNKCRKLRVSR